MLLLQPFMVCVVRMVSSSLPARTAIQLNKYVKEAPFADPEQSPYMDEIHVLKDDPNFEI